MKRLLILLPFALGGLALTACSNAEPAATKAVSERETASDATRDTPDDEIDASSDDEIEVSADEDTELSGKGQDVLFALDFYHSGSSDDLSDATDHLNDAAEAVTDSDFDTGADEAEQAADLFEQIHDDVGSLEGADGHLGTTMYEVSGLCADVLHTSADHVEDRDFDAMGADADDLRDCAAGLRDVTAIVESYT